MTCKKMSFEQIEKMVARRDGYTDVNEWREDTPEEERRTIYDLIGEPFDIVQKDGAKGYIFENDEGEWCIWFKY